MPKSLKIIITVIILALIVWIVAEKGERAPSASGTLDIGVISALTGTVAYIGESTMRGAEIGKIKVEADYPNLTINLHHEDSMFVPKTGIDAYNKLRTSNNINALITMASNVSVAVEPLAIQDNILHIAASTLANGFTTPNDLTFRVTSKVETGVSKVVEYLELKNLNKLAVIYMTNEIGVSLRDGLRKSLADSQTQIVHEEGFAPDLNDFRTLLLKVKGSGADSLYLASLASHTSTLLKQAKELGLNVKYISYQAAEDPVLIKNAGDLAEAVVYVSAYDVNSGDSLNSEFTSLYREKYGEDPNGYAAEAYEATRLVAETYVKCGSTLESTENIQCAKDFLFNIKNRPSLFGPLSFDSNGDVTYPFFLKTVRDGKFVRYEE